MLGSESGIGSWGKSEAEGGRERYMYVEKERWRKRGRSEEREGGWKEGRDTCMYEERERVGGRKGP